MMLLGDKIMYLRKKRGMTQQQLADKADVTHTTIGRIERNERDPHGATAVKIAKALGVTMEYLYGDTDIFEPSPEKDDQIRELVAQVQELDPIGFAINCRAMVTKLDELQPEDKQFLIGVLENMLTKLRAR